jgi:CRISPR system Cascade subunit CasB
MTRPFTSGSPITVAFVGWWHGLEADRGGRAELRRCADLLQVMQAEAFHGVRQRLVAAGLSDADSRNPRLAAIVALAAHVKATAAGSLPEMLSEGEKPRVSPLRFRQILESADDEELFSRLRRVLPLLDDHVNLTALAADVWYWSDRTRKRWVYDYRWPAKQPA